MVISTTPRIIGEATVLVRYVSHLEKLSSKVWWQRFDAWRAAMGLVVGSHSGVSSKKSTCTICAFSNLKHAFFIAPILGKMQGLIDFWLSYAGKPPRKKLKHCFFPPCMRVLRWYYWWVSKWLLHLIEDKQLFHKAPAPEKERSKLLLMEEILYHLECFEPCK